MSETVRMPALRPRVIRRVRRTGRDGRPKQAWDSRERQALERVRAKYPRACRYHACPLAGLIAAGEEYAQLRDERVPRGRFPRRTDFHFACLPPEARPMARFFLPPERGDSDV